MRCLVGLILLGLSLEIVGCGGDVETDEQRLKRLVPNAVGTTKVHGKITVDGAPVKDLWVTLHPADSGNTLRPRGQTDKDGNFDVTTYTGGDGAPRGEYKITVEWLRFQSIGGQWIGPDMLKDQYNNPKTTPFHVAVAETPVELAPFELKVEGVAGPKGAAPLDKKTLFKKPNRN